MPSDILHEMVGIKQTTVVVIILLLIYIFFFFVGSARGENVMGSVAWALNGQLAYSCDQRLPKRV